MSTRALDELTMRDSVAVFALFALYLLMLAAFAIAMLLRRTVRWCRS